MPFAGAGLVLDPVSDDADAESGIYGEVNFASAVDEDGPRLSPNDQPRAEPTSCDSAQVWQARHSLNWRIMLVIPRLGARHFGSRLYEQRS